MGWAKRRREAAANGVPTHERINTDLLAIATHLAGSVDDLTSLLETGADAQQIRSIVTSVREGLPAIKAMLATCHAEAVMQKAKDI